MDGSCLTYRMGDGKVVSNLWSAICTSMVVLGLYLIAAVFLARNVGSLRFLGALYLHSLVIRWLW